MTPATRSKIDLNKASFFRAIEPRRLRGDEDRPVERWLDSFDRYYKGLEADESLQALCLPGYLDGPAEQWYAGLPEATRTDLAALKAGLIKAFGRRNRVDDALDKLDRLRMDETKPVEFYVFEVRELLKTADVTSAAEQIRYFRKGLPYSLQEGVLMSLSSKSNPTLDDAIAAAQAKEDVLHSLGPPPEPSVAVAAAVSLNSRVSELESSFRDFVVEVRKEFAEIRSLIASNSGTQSMHPKGSSGCDYCHRRGHMKVRCDKFYADNGLPCPDCKEIGHAAGGCKGRIRGQRPSQLGNEQRV
eukprot:Rmarinus@m.26321